MSQDRSEFIHRRPTLASRIGACLRAKWMTLRRGYHRRFGPTDAEVARSLEETFSHLRIAPETALQFVHAYRRAHVIPLALPLRNDIRLLFLLSTNLIDDQGGFEKELRFVRLHQRGGPFVHNPPLRQVKVMLAETLAGSAPGVRLPGRSLGHEPVPSGGSGLSPTRGA